METKTGIKCLECGKSLKQFSKRKDWDKRPYHLKCWKEKMRFECVMVGIKKRYNANKIMCRT